MRVLAWNLNHRAARRRIPPWIAAAICARSPDLVVLTEYVEGADHASFLEVLRGLGLGHASISARPEKQNQVLIASREPQGRLDLEDPGIHQAVPSNALHVRLEETGIHVLGVRVPAFKTDARRLKRSTWEWLLDQADALRESAAIITGDLNTAPGDAPKYCGDCLDTLRDRGWQWARPADGFAWKHPRTGNDRRIDHLFVSPALSASDPKYLWDFQQLAPDAASGKVGLPDHAMLVADVAPRITQDE